MRKKTIRSDELPTEEIDLIEDINKHPSKYNKVCLNCTKTCKQLAFCKIVRCKNRVRTEYSLEL